MTGKRVSASLTIASAVALITVLGSLSGPLLAQAQPLAPLLPPPLAPACDSWQFPGGPVTLLYPPVGKTVFEVPAGTHVDAPGQTIGDNGSPPLPVHVVGDILGHSFTLTVNRDNFEPLNFIGQIRDDNKAHGFYQIGKTGSEVNFQTAEPLVCQPAPAPAPNNAAPGAKPPLNCDDPAVFDANRVFCGMAKNLVDGPTNAVTMNITVGLGTADVDIANTADISGTCKYDATAPLLPGVHKTFDLAANGSTSFSTLSPPLLSTYHVVLSCKGPWNGKTVEFGHVEQDVTAAG